VSKILTRARDIGKYLSDVLSTIQIANGFETDIGLQVFRGKLKIDDDVPPCAVVLEEDEVVGSVQGPSSQQVVQHYVLGGYMPCDPDHPNDAAHQIISDLKRAVFRLPDNATRHEHVSGTRSFGGRVKSVQYLGRQIGPRADGRAIVYAIIRIAVTYVEQLDTA